MIVHRQIHYSGRVQGVGFRYTVKGIAAGYAVTGWLRNLPDGRVELHAGGEAEEVEAFLQAIQASHLGGYIKAASANELSPPPTPWVGFEIRR